MTWRARLGVSADVGAGRGGARRRGAAQNVRSEPKTSRTIGSKCANGFVG